MNHAMFSRFSIHTSLMGAGFSVGVTTAHPAWCGKSCGEAVGGVGRRPVRRESSAGSRAAHGTEGRASATAWYAITRAVYSARSMARALTWADSSIFYVRPSGVQWSVRANDHGYLFIYYDALPSII